MTRGLITARLKDTVARDDTRHTAGVHRQNQRKQHHRTPPYSGYLMLQRCPSQRRLWRVRMTHTCLMWSGGSRRIVSACEESIYCRLICSNLGHGSYFPSGRDCRVKGDHREDINVTGVLFLIGVFVACFAVEGKVCVWGGWGGDTSSCRQIFLFFYFFNSFAVWRWADVLWQNMF